MGFVWDAAPRIFLAAGVVFVLAAGILVLLAPQAAIYPLALGAAFLLVAMTMAYERKPKA